MSSIVNAERDRTRGKSMSTAVRAEGAGGRALATVHALEASQASYGPECASACAFTSTLFAVYLVGSPGRKPHSTLKRLNRWLRMGCYLYETRKAMLARAQSVNPHDAAQRNTDSDTTANLVPTVGDYLEKISDHACILREAKSDSASLTTDQTFAAHSALITLDQALCLLALRALRAPVAAVITTAAKRAVHTIGMRVRKNQQARDTATALGAVVDPSGDASQFESARIDDFDQAEGCFYIDFIDSHSNNPETAQSAPGGVGVWIEFASLAALRGYLLKRYRPVASSSGAARDEMSSTRNCFDMQVWRERPGLTQEAREAFLKLFSDASFEQWSADRVSLAKTKREAPSEEGSRRDGKRANTTAARQDGSR